MIDAAADRADSLLAETASHFAESTWPELEQRTAVAGHEFPVAVWRRFAELGWCGLAVPAELGGADGSLGQLGLVLSCCAAAGRMSPLLSACGVVPSLLAVEHGPASASWLPRITGGTAKIGVALQEPHQRDIGAADVRTSVVASRSSIQLSGAKTMVAWGSSLDAVLCLARLPGGNRGFLIVPLDRQGVSVERLAARGTEPVFVVGFHDVELPLDSLLAVSEPVEATFTRLVDVGAALTCAELLGLAMGILAMTVRYVSERSQFGQAIGRFQVVQHHCADMYMKLEQVRVLTESALHAVSRGGPATTAASLAKVKASEAVLEIARLGHQLHGGVGYYDDYPLGRLHRNAISASLSYGSARWHRARLAKRLSVMGRELRLNSHHAAAVETCE